MEATPQHSTDRPARRRRGRTCIQWRMSVLLGACGLANVWALASGWLPHVRPIDSSWLRIALLCVSAGTLATAAVAARVVQQHRQRSSMVRLGATRRRYAMRVHLALAGADLGLWDWHLPSGRRTMNECGAAMLGITAQEASTIAAFHHSVHPDDANDMRRALDAHLRGEVAAYEAQFRMRHRNQGWVWVRCRGKVVERDANGAPLRVVGTRMAITTHKAAEETTCRLACYDDITDLPSGRLLVQRMKHAMQRSVANGQHGAVLLLGLDSLQRVTGALGYSAGKALLRTVAQRLVHSTKGEVTRLGSGEFVIVLEDLARDADAARVMAAQAGAAILRRLARPRAFGKRLLRGMASIGVALFHGEDVDPDTVLAQADLALSRARATRPGTLGFFDPSLAQWVRATWMLEEDLRAALARRQFHLHYQPIVDATGRVRGAEALLRWTHPGRGLMRPDVFVPAAEKTGLIVPLGHWVMEQACELLAAWAGSEETAQYTMAVNVSVPQLQAPDFVRRVESILARTGAPPARLKLELTESIFIDDLDAVAGKMRALRACGVAFALDDFGTGYSALGYLKKLPLSQLKIDRRFVRDVLHDPRDAAIARTIIALAENLALEVLAEGVETEAQFAFLRTNGCILFQGYLFGKPAPLDNGKLVSGIHSCS